MPILYKLGIYAAIITVIFSAGMLTEYKFNLASQVKGLNKLIERAQTGQNNIIKFHQDLRKANEKDACTDATIPPNTLKLLQQ